jgi:acetylornithine aminotransferase/acetylornithine/N-succinyldiaminopimelate aminotransferase
MEKQLEWAKHLDSTYYIGIFGNRIPVAFTHGKGIYLFSTEGKRYMDMLGGIAVNCLGHSNPRLVKAIAEQAKKLIHCSSLYYIPNQGELARELVERTFADRAFFCNSGAEANEAAIKLARAYFYKKGAPRKKFITAVNSFHGRTLACVTATGQPKYNLPFAPLPEGFNYVPYNDIEAMRSAVDSDTCAVMLELIQGESGVIPAEQAYIKAVRDICTAAGALLIIDEVQTGNGRTGTFFAYEQFGIKPDILTTAKGLAGGVPIGAMLVTEDASTGFAPGDHGSTFGGNPLAMAAALAVIQEIDSKHLLKNTQTVGAYIQKKITQMQKKSSIISSVRGMGLLIGIELSSPAAQEIKQKCFEKGYLVGSIGTNVIRIAPPLILTKRDASSFLTAFAEVLSEYTV